MARGDRFARGVAPNQDAAGHSLPSDKDIRYVELVLLCRACAQRGQRMELAGFGVETHDEHFRPNLVYERHRSRVVARDVRTDADGNEYVRYTMRCPACRNAPQVRQHRIDERLAAQYEQGARGRVLYWEV